MPRKNSLKVYVKGGYYHVYNRGVEKRDIFEDSQDYNVFLNYIKYSLSPPPKKEEILKEFTLQGLPFKGMPRMPKNFFNKIELISYCLMPNHFHLLLKQIDSNILPSFITSLLTRYVMFFNKKYGRVGRLFQSVYKAVLITGDSYLLHLSRYIHLNPQEYTKNLIGAYSSYADFLGLRKTTWIKPEIILTSFNKILASEFKKINSYKDFVEKYKKNDSELLGKLILEEHEK